MNIATEIEKLSTNPFIGNIAAKIGEIASSYGIENTPIGPAVETTGYARASAEHMGDWGGHEELAAYAYNAALDDLYRLIDIRWQGGELFYTTHAAGESPANWESYCAEVMAILINWINYDSWLLFQSDPYEILKG